MHTKAAYSLVSNVTRLPLVLIPLFASAGTADNDEGSIPQNAAAPTSAPETQSVEAYVQRLREFVQTIRDAGAPEAVRWMAMRAGRTIRPWFAEVSAGVLVTQVALTISDLFDDHSARH